MFIVQRSFEWSSSLSSLFLFIVLLYFVCLIEHAKIPSFSIVWRENVHSVWLENNCGPNSKYVLIKYSKLKQWFITKVFRCVSHLFRFDSLKWSNSKILNAKHVWLTWIIDPVSNKWTECIWDIDNWIHELPSYQLLVHSNIYPLEHDREICFFSFHKSSKIIHLRMARIYFVTIKYGKTIGRLELESIYYINDKLLMFWFNKWNILSNVSSNLLFATLSLNTEYEQTNKWMNAVNQKPMFELRIYNANE